VTEPSVGCFLEALSNLLLDLNGERTEVLLRECSQELQRQCKDHLLGSEPRQPLLEGAEHLLGSEPRQPLLKRYRLDGLLEQLLESRKLLDVRLLQASM
jgi:hypothetical protein